MATKKAPKTLLEAVTRAMNSGSWQTADTIAARMTESLGRPVKTTTAASRIRELRATGRGVAVRRGKAGDFEYRLVPAKKSA